MVTASPARAASARTASWSWCRCAARPTDCRSSSRTPDPVYYAARPTIAVPADRLLAKDGFFGLHPSMSALLPLWTAGKVAAVHATGLPTANRSHFSAMEELEDADPGSRGPGGLAQPPRRQ